MKRISLILIILFPLICFSQKPTDKLNPDSLNTTLIESLIKTKIDSVRKANKENALALSDTLKKAAKDQAKYIFKLKKLTHFQDRDSKKASPGERVAFYGLKNTSVAENIAFTYILTTIKNKKGVSYFNNSYQDVANDFVSEWVNSPGHYTNLTNAVYSLTAVAVVFDKPTKQIYAVQVFSSRK